MRNRIIPRRLLARLVPLFVIGFFIASSVIPARAHAQIAISTYPAFEAWAGVTETGKKIKATMAASLLTYLVNLMTFAADRLAYDAAVMVASGGPAESPLYDGTPVEQYFKEYGAAVAGESIGLLQEDLEASGGALGAIFSGFDLCQPRADITLALNLGIKSAFDRPTPKCDFKAIQNNWNGFLADVSDEGGPNNQNSLILTQLADSFDPATNEFAVGIELQSSILNKSLQDSFFKANIKIKENGFSPVTNFITGNIETPASVINYTWQERFEGSSAPDTAFKGLQIFGNNPDVLPQVALHAGSVFTNTLLSEFTQKLYDGIFNFDDEAFDPFGDIEGIAQSNSQSARDQYRSLLAFTPIELTNYSILTEFSTCPSGVSRGLYNCVANNSFVSAIGRADAGAPVTVEEALEQNLLDGSWPLIPSSDLARNQDPFCYTYGFCHTNLVKLRKARVISIGWELAAESIYNSSTSAVTLQEVVDGFDNCDTSGEADINHPWCKLIDPNWVLKYPETQCKALVNGQLLVSSDIGERKEECVDMPSCIAENDDGTCTGGYGYCVAEENTWRFRGESCPAEYASCLTFSGEDKTISYLENTVDFAGCTADNAGCLWYDRAKADPEGDGTYDWQPVADIATADAATDAYTSRIYFTSAVEECNGESGGCSELYERDDALRLNVIQNPSFEDDTNNDAVADGWLRNNSSVVINSTGVSRSGTDAIDIGSSNIVTQPGIAVSQGRFYTFSFYARQKVDGNVGNAQASLAFLAIEPGNDIDLDGTSYIAGLNTTCTVANSLNFANGDGLNDVLSVVGQPVGAAYERYSCTFTSPVVTDSSSLIVAALSIKGNVYVDDVQLEQGETASDYHVGYSTQDVSSITVKVPPSYLGCQGDESDPAECANYAEVCSENDVGCTAYTPTNGDPTVTGVATELDACPISCVGYDTFKQEPTLYEPAGSFPVYFIPETGESCSDEYVGCDEFTNLSTEALEYYTYLRACVTPTQADANTNGDNDATFYTWEGSDLEGYQLKTWILLESNMSTSPYTYVSGGVDSTPHLAPCSVWTATTDGIVCSDELDSDGDLKKDWDTAICDDHDDIFANPDCREFYDTNGGIHYREWSNTVTVNDACTAYRKTELVGADVLEQTANCQNSGGFFDAVTGTCRYNGYTEESIDCPNSANGCRSYTGGRSRNSRVVLEDTLENGNLNNWDAASAADVTLSNESLATGGHSIAATNQFSTFIFDNGVACADPAGCEGAAQTLGGSCIVIEGNRYCGILENNLFQGKTYTLSFWAKGSGTLTAAFDPGAVPGAPVAEIAFGTVTLTSGWQQFSLGPLNMVGESYPTFGPDTTLVFDPTSLAYIDNITLREGEDNITLIKDSWVTPAECDQSPTGAASPQYYLGCQEYRTQDSETAYLKSFSRLCDEGKVGCEDFFQTHESQSAYAEVFQATCANPSGTAVTSATSCYYENDGAGGFDTTSQYLCTIGVGQTSCNFDIDWYESRLLLPSHLSYGPATVVVPADSDLFLVVNDDVTCSSSAAGCTEVGEPTWSPDKNSTTAATSVFLMNDPDVYGEILCNHDELFCAAWGTEADGTFYFKDPFDQTCTYRADVLVNGSEYDGWFRTGTDEFCYGTCSDGLTSCSSDAQCGTGTCDVTDPSYLINGTLSGVWRNGDGEYSGSVAECPSSESTCSEFQDPLDLETNEVYQLADGKQYFYLNNDNLDENVLPDSQKCNGQTSLKEGCALFNDTSEPSQGYNSSASEMLSTHADVFLGQSPFALVDPIDCEVGDSTQTLSDGTVIDLCAQRCIYDQGAVNDITDGVIRGTKLQQEITESNAGKYDYDDLYFTGTSCFDISDCGTMRSEAGAEIAALDCEIDARVTRAGAPGGEERTLVPRLENDANTILKVNRDRQCSEWLSCAEDQASWDTRTNSWKTVCTDIQLCTKYSSSGGTTFCSEWKQNEPEIVLDNDIYTARDISWYGTEYSGYAIPDLFPVQTLEQANVSPPPGFCDLSEALKTGAVTQLEFDADHGEACSGNADCAGSGYCVTEDKEDYRLALVAGSCDGDFGDECSVGFCSETGSACSTTDECGTDGGECIAGSCQEQTGTLCASDSDCGDGEMCSGTQCVIQGADVTIESFNSHPVNPDLSCGAGEVFAGHIALQIGSCIREQCILTPDGETFDTATSEGKLCRAQPETDSPFSNTLVERWANPDNDGIALETGVLPTDNDDVPYSIRSGFENANFCAPGEDCECSYNKVTFGEGAAVRYWDTATDVSSTTGVCTSGKVNLSCSDDNDCDTEPGVSDDGVCAKVTREDVLLGLEGYCLEKDTGVNVNGDRATGACLTWLPVDQLAGSTDLYAKFTEAGYFADAFACTNTSPMANLYMSNHPETVGNEGNEGDIACADFEEAVGDQDVDDPDKLDVCAENTSCPSGYWTLMSMPHYKDGGLGTWADACAEGLGENECAFVCIPDGATIQDENDEMRTCDYDGDYVDELFDRSDITGGWFSSGGRWADDIKVLAMSVENDDTVVESGTDMDDDLDRYQRFDNLVGALADCSLKGVEVNAALKTAVFDKAETDGTWDDPDFVGTDNDLALDIDGDAVLVNYDYRELTFDDAAEFYPACEEITRVVDGGSQTGYAWTDRLLGPKTKNSFAVSSDQPGLDFELGTGPGDYGTITIQPDDSGDEWPLVATACQEISSEDVMPPTGLGLTPDEAPFNTCLFTGFTNYTSDNGATAADPSPLLQEKLNPATALARSFIGFRYEDGQRTIRSVWDANLTGTETDTFDIVNQLFAGVRLWGVDDNEYSWNADGSSWPNNDLLYEPAELGIHNGDESGYDVRAEEGNPPTVWSLLSGSCVGTACEEGDANSLTMNDQNNGDLNGTSFFRAYLKFYAAADKNQLPIRRVIIDWGDGIADRKDGFQGSDSDNNFYKNHRGLDDGTDMSICDLGNNWGETPESCDPNYFSYSHVYTCSATILEDNSKECNYNANGIVSNSPCWVDNGINGDIDRSCVFQPAVHVRDNWGWCSGVCPYRSEADGGDGGSGCYEGDDHDTLSDPGDAFSECGFDRDVAPGSDRDPWVYYDGVIIVDPQ
jgi:hypothetical protein